MVHILYMLHVRMAIVKLTIGLDVGARKPIPFLVHFRILHRYIYCIMDCGLWRVSLCASTDRGSCSITYRWIYHSFSSCLCIPYSFILCIFLSCLSTLTMVSALCIGRMMQADLTLVPSCLTNILLQQDLKKMISNHELMNAVLKYCYRTHGAGFMIDDAHRKNVCFTRADKCLWKRKIFPMLHCS